MYVSLSICESTQRSQDWEITFIDDKTNWKHEQYVNTLAAMSHAFWKDADGRCYASKTDEFLGPRQNKQTHSIHSCQYLRIITANERKTYFQAYFWQHFCLNFHFWPLETFRCLNNARYQSRTAGTKIEFSLFQCGSQRVKRIWIANSILFMPVARWKSSQKQINNQCVNQFHVLFSSLDSALKL